MPEPVYTGYDGIPRPVPGLPTSPGTAPGRPSGAHRRRAGGGAVEAARGATTNGGSTSATTPRAGGRRTAGQEADGTIADVSHKTGRRKKPNKRPVVFLRTRRYTGGGDEVIDVWLIRRDGAAESCLMYGQHPAGVVEKMVELLERELGLTVEEEVSPLEGQDFLKTLRRAMT